MNARIAVALGLAAAVSVGATQSRVTSAQQPREDALLTEIRGLRLAIEQLASVGARAQVMTSRLQLQEQRINTFLARLTQQRDRIPPVERQVTDLQRRLAGLQTSLDAGSSPPLKNELEDMLKVTQNELASQAAELRRLQGEEAELASVISTEQARWSELNRQLEQLDATLRR
jgi:chromosome segregation ATPase